MERTGGREGGRVSPESSGPVRPGAHTPGVRFCLASGLGGSGVHPAMSLPLQQGAGSHRPQAASWGERSRALAQARPLLPAWAAPE